MQGTAFDVNIGWHGILWSRFPIIELQAKQLTILYSVCTTRLTTVQATMSSDHVGRLQLLKLKLQILYCLCRAL